MPQSLPDTFHVIVDTVSCIMHYGFDILADVFGYYNGIIGLKFLFFRNRGNIKSLFSLEFSNFVAHKNNFKKTVRKNDTTYNIYHIMLVLHTCFF